MLIFVYGTLRRGGCRHHLLQGAQWVGDAVTQARYRLYDCGEYPAMIEAQEGRAIRGELWKISEDLLPRIDFEEGLAEGLYERRSIDVYFDKEWHKAIAYLYKRSVVGLRDLGESWSV